jgi:hypothetical protein
VSDVGVAVAGAVPLPSRRLERRCAAKAPCSGASQRAPREKGGKRPVAFAAQLQLKAGDPVDEQTIPYHRRVPAHVHGDRPLRSSLQGHEHRRSGVHARGLGRRSTGAGVPGGLSHLCLPRREEVEEVWAQTSSVPAQTVT